MSQGLVSVPRLPRRVVAVFFATLGLTAGVLLLGAASAQAGFGFVTKWGGGGPGNGEFQWPEGIATDAQGSVYVVDNSDSVFDTTHHRVQKFTAGGQFLLTWGRAGGVDWANPGDFAIPTDVATDSAGNVYVADYAYERIQKFRGDGTFITSWGMEDAGPPPNGNDNRGSFGIATDLAGNVYVAEYGNDQIVKFSSNGSFLMRWGTSGDGNGQLQIPTDVATDPAGNVYVVTDVRWIQKFNSTGTPLGRWRVAPESSIGNAENVGTDLAGNVYVTNGVEVRKFTSDGDFLMKWGTFGDGNGEFGEANYVATDRVGNVYVTDRNFNQRVQKFGRVPVITITKGPRRKTPKRKATFKFTSDEIGTAFECRLDKRKWKPCSSPRRVKKLKRGKHVFRVRGTVIGNQGKPTKRRWKVVRPR